MDSSSEATNKIARGLSTRVRLSSSIIVELAEKTRGYLWMVISGTSFFFSPPSYFFLCYSLGGEILAHFYRNLNVDDVNSPNMMFGFLVNKVRSRQL